MPEAVPKSTSYQSSFERARQGGWPVGVMDDQAWKGWEAGHGEWETNRWTLKGPWESEHTKTP